MAGASRPTRSSRAAFAADPYGTALPNGESLAHLEARVHAAVVDILAPFGVDDSGNTCASAVSHGDAERLRAERRGGRRCGRARGDARRRGTAALDAASAADAAAALEGAAAAVAADDREEPDEGLPETMDASAVASGFMQLGDGGSACLVAHDGPIRAILNHYLGVPPEKWWTLSTTHGGVSLMEFAGGCVTIRYVNATGHLDGLEPDSYVPSDDGLTPGSRARRPHTDVTSPHAVRPPRLAPCPRHRAARRGSSTSSSASRPTRCTPWSGWAG